MHYHNLPIEIIQAIASNTANIIDFMEFAQTDTRTWEACRHMGFLREEIKTKLPHLVISEDIKDVSALYQFYIQNRIRIESAGFAKVHKLYYAYNEGMPDQVKKLKKFHEQLHNKTTAANLLFQNLRDHDNLTFLIRYCPGLNINALLIACVKYGVVASVELCLTYPNIDLNYQDFLGKNALFYAQEKKNEELIELSTGGAPIHETPPSKQFPEKAQLDNLQRILTHLNPQLRLNSSLSAIKDCFEALITLLPFMTTENFLKVQSELTRVREIIQVLKKAISISTQMFVQYHTAPSRENVRQHSVILQIEHFIDQYQKIYCDNALSYAIKYQSDKNTLEYLVALVPFAITQLDKKLPIQPLQEHEKFTYILLCHEAKRLNLLDDFAKAHTDSDNQTLTSWLHTQSLVIPRRFDHETKKTQSLTPL